METSDHRTANSMHVFSSDTVKRGGRRRSRSYSLVKKVTRPPIYLVNQKRWRFLRRFFSSHTKKHRRLFRRKKTTVSPSPPSDPFFESITRPREKISSLKRCIDSISLFILSISRLSISRKRKRRKGKVGKGRRKRKRYLTAAGTLKFTFGATGGRLVGFCGLSPLSRGTRKNFRNLSRGR